MAQHSLISAVVFVGLAFAVIGAAADTAIHPDWRGQWTRIGNGNFDGSKPRGRGQQAPLTAEYQAILDASLADQERGGQGNDPGYRCHPHGMPRVMIGTQPLEFVITREATYILAELFSQLRRIYTDGRDWPAEFPRSTVGYSIGHWADTDGDGRYDTLTVETRGLSGWRSYDNSGIPFHADGKTVIKERLSLDKSNREILRNEITTIDNALTRPWTVIRSYRRSKEPQPVWMEYACTEDNRHVVIGDENYVVNAEGHLMPVRKGQQPPDLRHFEAPPQ
jgi:hypothetical protein